MFFFMTTGGQGHRPNFEAHAVWPMRSGDVLPPDVVAAPALSEWGLGLLLAVFATATFTRRRRLARSG